LTIPNRYSETVNLRTDNTMAEGKMTKGKTMIYKTLYRKLQLSNTNPTKP